ncbi:hypothetical protein [Nocardia acidivorans]|uniref:hypothetical protein n=1 Tax=Nocardia acidivorans TaxID=404580 RepID=UPI0012FA9174|nr:hypothetical protein [Nocardia acidivorans]
MIERVYRLVRYRYSSSMMAAQSAVMGSRSSSSVSHFLHLRCGAFQSAAKAARFPDQVATTCRGIVEFAPAVP